jgi:hypothetical protein
MPLLVEKLSIVVFFPKGEVGHRYFLRAFSEIVNYLALQNSDEPGSKGGISFESLDRLERGEQCLLDKIFSDIGVFYSDNREPKEGVPVKIDPSGWVANPVLWRRVHGMILPRKRSHVYSILLFAWWDWDEADRPIIPGRPFNVISNDEKFSKAPLVVSHTDTLQSR